MAEPSARLEPNNAALRGFDGKPLSPAEPPAPGEPPSPAWLAQLGRAPFGDYADGREVVTRLTDAGLGVPGDDPLYQYLGAQRVFAEVLKSQQADHMGAMRTLMEESRQALARQLAEAGDISKAAAVARRREDEATVARYSAALDEIAVRSTRALREAFAEERDAFIAAVELKVAAALARAEGPKAVHEAPARPWRPFSDLGKALEGRGRSVAAWAALLAISVIAGLAVLWILGHVGHRPDAPL